MNIEKKRKKFCVFELDNFFFVLFCYFVDSSFFLSLKNILFKSKSII